MLRRTVRNFEVEVIKILRAEHFPQTDHLIRIVRWINSNKPSRPHLEKREFIYDKQGKYIEKRSKSFNVDDIKFIVENSLDIVEIMEGTRKPEDVPLVEISRH